MKHDEIHAGVVSRKYDKYLEAVSEYGHVKSFFFSKYILPFPFGTVELPDHARRRIEERAIVVKQRLLEFLEL